MRDLIIVSGFREEGEEEEKEEMMGCRVNSHSPGMVCLSFPRRKVRLPPWHDSVILLHQRPPAPRETFKSLLM